MSLTQSKVFKVWLGPVLLFSSLLMMMYAVRVTTTILFLALIGCYIHFVLTSKTKWLRLVFVAFLISAYLPVDISLRNHPGPPRFVPLIMGMPASVDFARQQRGEVALGGCFVRGNEPKWILVW